MENSNQADEHGTVSMRVIEMATALAIMALGALVMYDSHRIGASWASDGPQAGYFPFYVGVLMFAASAVVLVQAAISKMPRRRFVDREQFKSILTILAPTIVFVAVIAMVGIYIASAIYLAYFMKMLGRYKWHIVAPVAIGVPALLFVVFEIWFLVPLPKGPVESYFGF